MFKNAGQKIKSIAQGAFIIEMIAGIIGGFVIMSAVDMYGGQGFLGLLTIVLSPCVAYLSNILIYGFGVLVERAEKALNNYSQDSPSKHITTTTYNSRNSSDILKSAASKIGDHTTSTSENSVWTCPSCGQFNRNKYTRCEKCGKPKGYI